MSDMVFETEVNALNWIRWINNDKMNVSIPCVVLAVEQRSSKKCIGLIGVAPKRELNNEIEILFSISDEYQNQGYITEAGRELIKWTFVNTPATYLVAIIKHENGSSNRVIEKLGFIYSGEREFDYDGKMTKFHYYRLNKESQKQKVISVREHPEYCERAINYFSSKWGIDRKIYEDSIKNSLTTESPIPRWYLMINENDEIIGSFGLIMNDFVSRQDLFPYLCALYIEENERGKALGSQLLLYGRKEAKKLGFNKLYLCTDHIGYYEKYEFNHIGTGYHPWGDSSRIYESDTL